MYYINITILNNSVTNFNNYYNYTASKTMLYVPNYLELLYSYLFVIQCSNSFICY